MGQLINHVKIPLAFCLEHFLVVEQANDQKWRGSFGKLRSQKQELRDI